MLDIHNATLCYAEHLIFADLSFSLAPCQWLAIMGPSGVGKTTVLRLIAGLHYARPEPETKISGVVTWQGHTQFEVSYMAQQDALFPWLSVLDNVLLPFHLSGKACRRLEAQKLLQAVGLKAYQDHKPKTLSGGMRQRVALARTLIQHRELVLMDEPFSALDAMTRMEMQDLSANLLRPAQKTVVMVTHDPWEALRLADTILILGGNPATIVTHIDLPFYQGPRDITDPKMIKAYQSLMGFCYNKRFP